MTHGIPKQIRPGLPGGQDPLLRPVGFTDGDVVLQVGSDGVVWRV